MFKIKIVKNFKDLQGITIQKIIEYKTKVELVCDNNTKYVIEPFLATQDRPIIDIYGEIDKVLNKEIVYVKESLDRNLDHESSEETRTFLLETKDEESIEISFWRELSLKQVFPLE